MKRVIQVVEHHELKIGATASDGSVFGKADLQSISAWVQVLKTNKNKAERQKYSAIELKPNAVKFKSYVGVIVTGNLQIEVLPKIDQSPENNGYWQQILIEMLLFTGEIEPRFFNEGSLNIFPGAILEIYFHLFLRETERILQFGLIKKYQQKNELSGVLRGKWHIEEQLQSRPESHYLFHISAGNFTAEHPANLILGKALHLISILPLSSVLRDKARQQLRYFPDNKQLNVTEVLFQRLAADRQTQRYEKAINYARLILLNYYPNIDKGRNDVFALLFNMNTLWEKFIIRSLKSALPDGKAFKPTTRDCYWQADSDVSVLKHNPDLFIYDKETLYIADAKWKQSPVAHTDVRQLYIYTRFYGSDNGFMIYPGKKTELLIGRFVVPLTGTCSILRVYPIKNGRLNRTIGQEVLTLMRSVG